MHMILKKHVVHLPGDESWLDKDDHSKSDMSKLNGLNGVPTYYDGAMVKGQMDFWCKCL